MRRRLLDLIVCPACRGSFELEVFAPAPTSAADSPEQEVIDGALRCTGCNGTYPVIGGVPRLLAAPLLRRMRARYPAFFTAHLSAFYWEPLRLARRAGLGSIVERFPLSDYVDHSWGTRIAGVHDRLSTPITHFHDLPELSEWCQAAGLQSVRVEDTDRRGWRAYGRRGAATA